MNEKEAKEINYEQSTGRAVVRQRTTRGRKTEKMEAS
jgi:hypothetical protein